MDGRHCEERSDEKRSQGKLLGNQSACALDCFAPLAMTAPSPVGDVVATPSSTRGEGGPTVSSPRFAKAATARAPNP